MPRDAHTVFMEKNKSEETYYRAQKQAFLNTVKSPWIKRLGKYSGAKTALQI